MGLWWEHLVHLPSLLEKIISSALSLDEAYETALAMLKGDIDDVGIAAILAALRARGEKPQEVAGFSKALRATCLRVNTDNPNVIDTAGTGGDRSHTLNVSTASALAASALGAVVAKHGNRSVSSRSGSADFMEKLGYPITHGPRTAECLLRKVRFAFLYAPKYHPAMARVMPVRRKLGIRTIFNLVGPLSNPAGVKRQLLGVSTRSLLSLMAEAGANLGYEHLLVVHGSPGLDEISVSGETIIVEVRGGSVEEYKVSPRDLGVSVHPLKDLKVESVEESVERVMAVFRGGGRRGDRDFIAVNTGFALYVAGVVRDPRDGVELALKAFGEGVVAQHVEKVIEASRECLEG